MKIVILSPGKMHDPLMRDAIEEYEKRVGRRLDIEWFLPPAGDKEDEATALFKQLKDGDYVVLLDERGKDIDTPGLAALLDKRMQESTKRLVFIIGGAYGIDESLKKHANATYKLSSLVFPHMLVRLILVEQLYRALSILEGGKYHHA